MQKIGLHQHEGDPSHRGRRPLGPAGAAGRGEPAAAPIPEIDLSAGTDGSPSRRRALHLAHDLHGRALWPAGPDQQGGDPGHPLRLRHQHAHRRARRARFGAPAIGADAPLRHPRRLRCRGRARPGRLRQRPADAQQDRRRLRAHRAGGRSHRRGGRHAHHDRRRRLGDRAGGARGRQEARQDGGTAHRRAHRCLSLRRHGEIQLRHPVHPRRRGRTGRSGLLLARRHPRHDLRAGRRAARA